MGNKNTYMELLPGRSRLLAIYNYGIDLKKVHKQKMDDNTPTSVYSSIMEVSTSTYPDKGRVHGKESKKTWGSK